MHTGVLLPELVQRLRQQGGLDGGNGAEVEASHLRCCLLVSFHSFVQFEYAGSIGPDPAALRTQAHRVASALEQLAAQVFLEAAYLQAYRRLRQAEALACGREGRGVCSSQESAKVAEHWWPMKKNHAAYGKWEQEQACLDP